MWDNRHQEQRAKEDHSTQIRREMHAAGARRVKDRRATRELAALAKIGVAIVDEVVADMTSNGGFVGGFCREVVRQRGDVRFHQLRFTRELFDDVTIHIARREIDVRIDMSRILAEQALDDADRFDERLPVERIEQTQAADAVADGNLIRGLFALCALHELVAGEARFGQALVDPRHGQRERIAERLQPPRELRDERARHRRLLARHIGGDEDQPGGIPACDVDHRIGPSNRDVAIGAIGADAVRNAAEVLDQREAQHDRNRPEFTQRERTDLLIGGHETAQRILVEAAVAVGDRLQGDVVDARKAGRQSFREHRQLPAVAARQMPACGADLLVDEIEVVEQPLAGGRYLVVGLDGLGENPAALADDLCVLGQTLQQRIGRES